MSQQSHSCISLARNTKTIDEVEVYKIDQGCNYLCTNGRLEDLVVAAEILKVKKCIGTRNYNSQHKKYIYKQCMGLLKHLLSRVHCFNTNLWPCLGGHMGILARRRCVATTNRNFVGRMGHTESEVYLQALQLQQHQQYWVNSSTN